MKHGSKRRTGQITQQGRRAQEPRVPPEKRHGHAIAAEMPVHENGHHLVVAQAPPDLKRRIERLPHFQRLGAQTLANRIANAIDVGARLRHGDDRELRGHGAPHQEASHLPVAAMAGHDDDAAPFGEESLEQFVALGRVIEQLFARRAPASARRKSMLSNAYARKVASARRWSAVLGLFRKNRAKIVGDRRAACAHQLPGDPRADRADGVRHRSRQHADAVIRRAENEAVVQAVQRPASRHDAVAARPAVRAPVSGRRLEGLEESIVHR